MCGILGIATTTSHTLPFSPATIAPMRDHLAHRGPDSRGTWMRPHLAFAHTRLAVLDPSPAADQPMISASGPETALLYNGELYNDLDLRRQLPEAPFRTASDTETLLHALTTWGPAALPRLRGMYAFAFYDSRNHTLLLARDPLGIKPLYYHLTSHRGQPLLTFGSEIPALLAAPHITPQPDLITLSAYLTTIRTVLGRRTLFKDIFTLRPGEALLFDLTRDDLRPRTLSTAPAPHPAASLEPANLRAALEESVQRHLRADVPLCCLLSGGLDSSIIAATAARHTASLNTYCAGAAPTCDTPPSDGNTDDFTFARRLAAALGTHHRDIPITPALFTSRWHDMVARLGTPLSTPNEVAIHEVALALREDGHIVTLTGEGADELFGGYAGPMAAAVAYEADHDPGKPHPGLFQLISSAWIEPALKPTILSEDIWRALEHDHHLTTFYTSEFNAIAAERSDDDSPLQAHLRFHRRINLAGLLQRLDTATMLASVEGRTPFADAAIASLAEALPMHQKYHWTGTGDPPPAATKRILRDAFSDLPADILTRAKASFPLPFHDWLDDTAPILRESAFARELLTPAALHAVAANPRRLWRLAWPLFNIALWADRWWR